MKDLFCLSRQRGQNQSPSPGSDLIPTHGQWYQSSQLSQPIMGDPSSGSLHPGQIHTFSSSSSLPSLDTFLSFFIPLPSPDDFAGRPRPRFTLPSLPPFRHVSNPTVSVIRTHDDFGHPSVFGLFTPFLNSLLEEIFMFNCLYQKYQTLVLMFYQSEYRSIKIEYNHIKIRSLHQDRIVEVSEVLTLGILDLESESLSESEDSILFFLEEDDFSFFFSFFFLSFLDNLSLFSCFRSDSNDGVGG